MLSSCHEECSGIVTARIIPENQIPEIMPEGAKGRCTPHTKNLNMIHAIRTIRTEYFRPATALPSPICPATRPEKNPWMSAAWVKSRV